jgi:anhydro-N-acetylmuramic acid kinase
MDGLDVALADLRWEGDTIVLAPLAFEERRWPEALHERLKAVLPPNTTTAEEIAQLDTLVGQEAAAAVAHLGADLIAAHGQTIYHWVEGAHALGTLQIGQPAWIAEATGTPVISDLRARDIAAGGHGAPLAGTLDVLWLQGDTPRAALNLGGIANVTVVGGGVEPVCFDTGPANCLLDVAAARATNGELDHDRDGALASRGRADEDALRRLLDDKYYAQAPPKSTGREHFHADYVAERVGLEAGPDLLATLTELTAATIAQALEPYGVTEVIASGGGVRNPALMAALKRRLGVLTTTADHGLDPAAKEAHLMALIGFLTWHGVPGVPPRLTGAPTPRVLGRKSPGTGPLRLAEPQGWPARLVISREETE